MSKRIGRDLDLAERLLGETAGVIWLDGRSTVRKACALMASQATRGLRILSRDLDAVVYDQADFLESVRRLALRGPRALVQILLFDTEPAVRQGHRLIELYRELPSHIQIRLVPDEFDSLVAAYLLADDLGYVLRPLADLFEGTADFSARAQVRHMRDEFEHIWERSSPPVELISFGRGL